MGRTSDVERAGLQPRIAVGLIQCCDCPTRFKIYDERIRHYVRCVDCSARLFEARRRLARETG